MSDQFPPPTPTSSAPTASAWWKRKATWIVAGIAVVLVLGVIGAATKKDDATPADTDPATTTTITSPVRCDEVSADVREIGEGIEITTWYQLAIPETTGGFNSIVQGRGPAGIFTWAVDQEAGEITGFTTSLDQPTSDASGYPYDPVGDYGNAIATAEVLDTVEYTQINDCG